MQLCYKKVGRCSQHRCKIFHFRSQCSQVQSLSPSSRFLCWFQHEESLQLVLQVLCCTTIKPRNARCVSWCHLLPSEQKRDAYDSIIVEFTQVHGSCDGFLSWVRKCISLLMIVLNPLGEWQRGINTFPAWASRLSINCSSVSCSFEVDRPNQEDNCRSPSCAWWRVAVVLFSLPGWLGIQVPEARTLSLLQTELLSMWRALLAARHRGWNSPSWCSSGPQGSVAIVVGLDLWCSLRNLLLFSSWGMRSARRLHKSFCGRSLLFFFSVFLLTVICYFA